MAAEVVDNNLKHECVMKKFYFFAASVLIPFMADAQSAIDGFRFSQPDLKGTARYMGMAGAFGALGGDLSSISTNPAGIGVYRRNEIGITMDIDVQSVTSESQGLKNKQSQTNVLLNNVGGVATWNLMNSTMPNFNIGFTYNRLASYNSHYAGDIPNLRNSLTDYIAGVTNVEGLTVGDLVADQSFDPYNPPDIPPFNSIYIPWISVLGYNSYFISPEGDEDQPKWKGQWGPNTSGVGMFDVLTSGGANEYNIAVGGNIANKIFWGLDLGIVDMTYNMTARWGENLKDAVVQDIYGDFRNTSANWDITNFYHASATGYNIKLGLIYRPIQELRLGLSFSSPTWYSVNESYIASTYFEYPDIEYLIPNDPSSNDYAVTNGGEWGLNSYNFRTPWKLTASAAGVIGRNLILSADVEWQKFNKMRFYYGGSSSYYDSGYNFGRTNNDIEEYYKTTTTVRLGVEYRITPRFSVRAGYAHVASPVTKDMKDDSLPMPVTTSGTMPNYRNDNSTSYITFGLGYNFNSFYIDGAYVHKSMSSTYHAYTFDPGSELYNIPPMTSPSSKLSLNNNQIVLSAGVRF